MSKFQPKLGEPLLFRQPFDTDSGQKSYSDIEEELFIPLGFKARDRSIIPSLEYLERRSCSEVIHVHWHIISVQIFDSFLSGSRSQNESAAPPKAIPTDLKIQYLLRGYTHLIEVSRSCRWRESERHDLCDYIVIPHLMVFEHDYLTLCHWAVRKRNSQEPSEQQFLHRFAPWWWQSSIMT